MAKGVLKSWCAEAFCNNDDRFIGMLRIAEAAEAV